MMLPIIHSNGTSREALIEAYVEALTAIDYALDAIKYTVPNDRDYYPRGPDATHAAWREHTERVRRLHEIRDELYALSEHCELSPNNSMRDVGREKYKLIGRPRDERF